MNFGSKYLNVRPASVNTIMMVCTMNQCRSPMAEAWLRTRLAEHKLAHIQVNSSGVSAWNGAPPTAGAIRVCQSVGIDIQNYRSQALTIENVNTSDLILAMESGHVDDIYRLFPDAQGKTTLLGAFLDNEKDMQIQDPVGKPDIYYQRTFLKIQRCVDKLIIWLSESV